MWGNLIMKRTGVLFACLALSAFLQAQDAMYIHMSDAVTLGVPLSKIEDISFSGGGTTISLSMDGTVTQYSMADIDSISFGASSDTVSISYNGANASVINPLAFEGVSVNINGSSVTIHSTDEAANVNYKLSGATSNGLFKLYGEKKCNLFLDGLTLANPNGPAVNIQSGKKTTVYLLHGTANTLTDGVSYADSTVTDAGATEDQKAAFFSEGPLVFNGTGGLTIHGNGTVQHALCSDDFIQIDGGSIVITGAAKDGMHANDGIVMTNGTVDVTASGDAMDGGDGNIEILGGGITTKNTAAEAAGMRCDSALVVSGGTIRMTVGGDGAKGLKSGKNMTLTGGTFVINTSGNAALIASGSGFNPSYCTGIKCDSMLTINGADITLTSSGKGGKGISSDGDLEILGGSVKVTTSGAGATYMNSSGATDAYNATSLTANGDIRLLGGTITANSSGSAGKGITADGALTIGDESRFPEISVTTTGAKITISAGTGGGGGWPGGGPGGGGPGGTTGDYAEAKAISCGGAVTINNGTVVISSADDGIKSATSIVINNGAVSINKSVEGMEAPFITVNAGDVGIAASDDGFNATHGNGGESNDGSCLTLNGGNVRVNTTTGDAIDSNGNIVMTSGTVVAHGPSSAPEVGMDYNGTFNVSGGVLLVSGPNSGNMIQATSASSSQYTIKATTSSMLNASTLFHIQDANGNNLATFKPVRNVYYVVFSSPELKSGSTYSIYTGGSCTGVNANGLYVGGTYSGGTFKTSFTLSGKVTNVSF
jgi:trimeric autotransporter adhesin